jgi:hypothetical protein
VARHRVLRLRRVNGCFGTSRGSSRRSSSTTSPRTGSSSTTSPTPRIRVARHISRLVSPLAVDYFAYATHPGASARRAARHTARHRLLRAPQLRLAPHWLYFSHAVRHVYLSRGNTGSTLSTPRATAMSSFSRIASTIHLD